LVMESSHVPLNKWVLAFRLMAGSKKGISAHQLHRTIGVTYKTAWFMAHRIRESMKDTAPTPLGGVGKDVEADETYFGDKDVVNTRTRHGKAGHSSKRSVVALVERGGAARSFHIERANQLTISKILADNVHRKSRLHTDESGLYNSARMVEHHRVTHSQNEYVRRTNNRVIHSNTVENYFSVFKRGMRGTYQHCGEQHLHRYLTEFDFRYSNRMALGVNDEARAMRAIKGAAGKRLTYRQSRSAQPA